MQLCLLISFFCSAPFRSLFSLYIAFTISIINSFTSIRTPSFIHKPIFSSVVKIFYTRTHFSRNGKIQCIKTIIQKEIFEKLGSTFIIFCISDDSLSSIVSLFNRDYYAARKYNSGSRSKFFRINRIDCSPVIVGQKRNLFLFFLRLLVLQRAKPLNFIPCLP